MSPGFNDLLEKAHEMWQNKAEEDELENDNEEED